MTIHNTVAVLAAGGVDSINNTIGNFTTVAQTLGGSLITLILVGLAITLMTGALGQGGRLRESLGKILVVVVAGLFLGGAGLIAPMLVNTGKELPKSSTSTNDTGVN